MNTNSQQRFITGPVVTPAVLAAAMTGSAGLVERPSGIMVPPSLEGVKDYSAEPDTRKPATVYDLDGRRRIAWTKAERKQLNATIRLLRTRGLGIVVGCGSRDDGRESCGQPLTNEDKDGPDDGYGCQCTRIHFIG